MPEGAVYVGRPSRFGNHWRAGEIWDQPYVWHVPSAAAAIIDGSVKITEAIAVDLFRADLVNWNHDTLTRWLAPLRGHDLACWCPLDQPCHADVLLELARTDELHRRGGPTVDPRIWLTPCGIRYTPGDWPRSLPRPRLPRCGACRG
jgi:hypothetical protein